MLSTKVISSGSQAAHYFFKTDDYYTKESGLNEKPSVWYGKGAEKLNLQGEVSKEQFKELLSGKLPNGDQIGLKKNGEISHRAGFDLTFSAPKSWSIAHYLTKDPIFGELLEKAVKNTIDLIEKDCAMAYRYEKGVGHMEKTGNLIASLHFHRLSRELEPQDHVHAVIMNATEREDGKWRALKSDDPNKKQHEYSEGFIERIRPRKKDLGMIFRGELASLAVEHGFPVEFTKDGFWELKNIPKDLIPEFSTRRSQIESHLEENNLSGGKAAAAATLITRNEKAKLSKEEISQALDARFAKFNLKINIETLKNDKDFIPLSQYSMKKTENSFLAIKYAIAHLSEKQGLFTESKLISIAMKHYPAKVNIDDCLKSIQHAKNIGLINLVSNQKGNVLYVSQEQISYEKSIISDFKAINERIVDPIIKSERKFEKLCSKYADSLTIEQKTALKETLLSNNGINAIDGKIGSGKTHLLPIISKFSKKSWLKPIILTLSEKEHEPLKVQTGAELKTVSGYLKELEIRKNKTGRDVLGLKNNVLLVDSSQKLSTRQTQGLIKLAKDENLKLTFLFDSRQPESMAPGNSMKLLKEIGINTAKLSTSIRQLNKINVNTVVDKDDNARLNIIANDYISLIKTNFDKDIKIIAQNKLSKNILNNKIQTLLKDENAHSISNECLNPVFLTKEQYKIATQYKKGQVVTFSKNYSSISVTKGEYYKILSIDKKNNLIKMDNKGELVYWNPEKVGGRVEGAVRIYQPETKTFYEGDKLSVNDSNKNLKFTKGKVFTIKSIDDNKVILSHVDSSKNISIKRSDLFLKHLDLSYAKTSFEAYNDSPDIILAEQVSNKKQTNLKQFYKILGQCKENLTLYTDNKEKHLSNLDRYQGESKPIVNELIERINGNNAKLNKNISSNNFKSGIDKVVDNIELAEKISKGKEIQLSNILKAISSNIRHNSYAYSVTKHCINLLNEKEAVFTKYELTSLISKEAFKLKQTLKYEKIDKAIDKCISKKQLIKCSLYKDEAFTTPNAIKQEYKVLNLAKNSTGRGFNFLNLEKVNRHLDNWQKTNTTLSNSQIKAVKTICTTKNSLTLINGLAGVGKTTMLSAIKPLCEAEGVKMIGIAPTNSAVKEIRTKGIESYTIDSYLNSLAKNHKEKTFNKKEKVLLVLDESSMASTNKMNNLLKLTKDANYRIAFVGDVNQLASIEQGKMFHMLQKEGIETTFVNDIIRQKDSPEYLSYVKALYKGNFSDVINRMHNNGAVYTDENILRNNPDINKDDTHGLSYARCDLLSDILISKDENIRSNTRVVTPANKDRKLFNKLYREKLQSIGEVSQKEYQANILVDARLSPFQKAYSHNYEVAQILKFNTNLNDNNIKKNDYLTIKSIDYKNNQLNLKDIKGKDVALNLNLLQKENSWKATIYNTETRNIAKGDVIRWSYTDKENNRINMDEASVISINEKEAIVKDKDGVTQKLEYKKFNSKHWDYAYAGTAYTEQGKTAQHVAILMTSDQAKLATKPAFLVGITRAMKEGILVTDNAVELTKRLEVNIGAKTSALEVLKKQKTYKISTNEINRESKKNIRFHKSSIRNNSHNFVNYNIKDINQALHFNVKDVVTHILGNPKKQDGKNFFYGSNKGSLAVTVNGEYQGLWHDFDTGEKGNVLNLIQTKLNLSFKDALEYAAKLVNHVPSYSIEKEIEKIGKNKSNNTIGFTEDEKKRISFANKIANEARNINGTLAEKYLKEIRGISLNNWPKDIKYHDGIYSKLNESKNPALVITARDKDNNIQAIQAIYLNEKGEKADVNVQKQTFGVIKGAVFSINNTKSKTAIISEGMEDALSIFKADKTNNVFACLGKSNFNNLPKNTFQLYEKIIFALDNDGKNIQDIPKSLIAASRLDNLKTQVSIMQPNVIKQDYNDILKNTPNGLKNIARLIQTSINYKEISHSKLTNKYANKSYTEISSNIVTKSDTNSEKNNNVKTIKQESKELEI